MPFLKRGSPITRYLPQEAPTKEILQQAAEHLARRGFRSIDTLPDAASTGWVCFGDPTDSEWRTGTPDLLSHLVWTLRHDKRTVPAELLRVRTRAEIKKFLERRRAEIQEKVLIPFVNKDERNEIKERVYLSLLSQAAPVPVLADVIWISPADPAQAEVWLCATTEGLRDKFTFHFSQTFKIPVRPVVPWTLQPEGADWPENIGERFLTWLYGHDGGAMDVRGTDLAVKFDRVTIADGAGEVIIKAITGETDPEHVKQGIGEGMLVRDCVLALELSGIAYTVGIKGKDFTMRVETPEWFYDREDPDGSFADKVLSLGRLFDTWDTLYRLWLVQTGRLPEAEVFKPAVAVERAAQNALAELGAKSVKQANMSVIKGGKHAR